MSVRDHRDRGAHSSLAVALERAIVLQRLRCSFIAQSPLSCREQRAASFSDIPAHH